ncbi:TetR/AcrR family transcriptional regulator [Chelativorans salis]|uniref:TetR/AcrR family transcriptional regulator n=1 Tax=Chelativorans salis TaxID=2978478 RepID=A0ABT2LKP5_9HYPH|nr:TetR/AcrR family transcriptional regulator [Chelativorans sp. EGI FJ00035]MCT7374949.1 TetR/AcrR family transcriptional regulator [Chelativorans sp. EGI FJ00035]
MAEGAEKRLRKTRNTILSAATELFLKHGFLGTNMDEIAKRANVSKQTVYAHFGTKETLFLEIIEGMTGSAADALRQRVSDPVDDRPIEAFLMDFAEQQLAIVMTPRLLQLRRLVIAEAERFPELGKALYARGPQRSIDRLAEAFAHYNRNGWIKADDPQAAASFFNWLVMGEPVNRAMFLGDEAIPPAAALRRHAEESVRIFLAAYGAGQ